MPDAAQEAPRTLSPKAWKLVLYYQGIRVASEGAVPARPGPVAPGPVPHRCIRCPEMA